MDTVYIVNTFIEIYSLILSIVIHLYMVSAKHSGDRDTRKHFMPLLASNIFMILGDGTEWICSGFQDNLAELIMMIGITVYYASLGVFLMFFVRYIEVIIGKSANIPKFFQIAAYVIGAVQILMSVVNFFTHHLYYVDENFQYVYTNFTIAGSCTFLGFVLSLFMIVAYGRKLPRRTFANLIMLILLPALGSILQTLLSYIAFTSAFYTIALLSSFLFIQAENSLEFEQIAREAAQDQNEFLKKSRQTQELLITQIITALAYSVEAKDRYTNGHSVRVANYVREIVHRMGYNEQEQLEAYYMGLLHDIGKLRIPDEIINKKSKLTDEEFAVIKLHTVSGYHILKAITVLPDLSIGARWHHERWDGSGYPNGLSGENIPLMARIIAVADAYDAMTSNRSYRKTMSQEKVRSEIERGMGTQFDPQIAQIMLDMIDADVNYDMKQTMSKHKDSILVVDDDEFMHRFISLALANENYLITCVSSAAEAIKLLEVEDFDLCLLDVQMPDMNGFEFYEWIQKNKHNLKVIFVSGDKEFERIAKAGELGVADYITKPVMVQVLKETIKNVLLHSA